jgi:polyferredoxin
VVWARRAVQAGCLLVFLFFLTQTTFRGSFDAAPGAKVRLPYAVEAFLLLDPFVAALTALSTHKLYAGLAWSLGVVFLTLVFGRVFCGWICPFGTLHQILSWLWPGPPLKTRARIDRNRTQAWQRYKYLLMIALLGSAALGSAIGGLFDPICMMVRGLALGVLPALEWTTTAALDRARRTHSPGVQIAADHLQEGLSETLWGPTQVHFHAAWFVTFIFVAIVLANRFIPRFWCRALCPLGAFLGVLSKFSLFGFQKAHAKCTDCNLCLVHCQGADSPEGGAKHRQEECHGCFNCVAACPEDVLEYRFLPDRTSTAAGADVSRREVMTGALAGAALVPAMRIGDWPGGAYSEKVIRPPGAVAEADFLDRCIRCAECMKVCPNNALHPALFEAGPEGLWTPILIPRIGYCEHSCVLCGQVCPTGAIAKIEEKDKLGQGVPPVRIGTAMFDRGRCLPWAMATPCTVCEEFCPTSPKAIWVEEVQVPRRARVARPGEEGQSDLVTVRRPHIDPSLCIGCGACEKVCPVVDRPAVYVTSAGESRSQTNVILLEDSKYS